jgi:glycosyltransferase involved in cell wall biosynthesis
LINWQDIKNPLGGGAEVHMHEIFKRIAAKGNEIFLLSCESEGFPEYEEIDGIKVFRKGSRSIFNFFVPFLYRKLRKKYKFDIVIDDINKIPFYTPLFVKEPILAISHHFFGKSIYREANFIAGTYVFLSEKLVNFVYRKSPFAVVSDSTLNEFIERGFDKSKFNIITNAIAHESFPMDVSKKNDKLTVTYFGRLKKYKSVDHLFKAFALVKKEFPNSKLEIIGRGDFQPFLEILSKKLGFSDSVIFHGFVSDQEKAILLARSHIVVNTSMKEGWGITNIEANACGTPTVSANVPGLRDSVKNGESGLLYEYGNIQELADKIKLIFSDEKLRNHLSNGAVDWAKTFSWDKSANEMIELMQKVLKNNKIL